MRTFRSDMNGFTAYYDRMTKNAMVTEGHQLGIKELDFLLL